MGAFASTFTPFINMLLAFRTVQAFADTTFIAVFTFLTAFARNTTIQQIAMISFCLCTVKTHIAVVTPQFFIFSAETIPTDIAIICTVSAVVFLS